MVRPTAADIEYSATVSVVSQTAEDIEDSAADQ